MDLESQRGCRFHATQGPGLKPQGGISLIAPYSIQLHQKRVSLVNRNLHGEKKQGAAYVPTHLQMESIFI